MYIKSKVSYLFIVIICSLFLFSSAQAANQATLTLKNTSGDAVQLQISGDINSSIKLSYLPTGGSSLTTIAFGTTDASGNFSTSISSGGYAIPAGSPVYVNINGSQSPTLLWPNFTSSLTFSQNSLQVAVGQSITINGSNSLTLVSNSSNTNVGASVSGSQVTITGISAGSGTLMFCSSNVGCNSVAVVVGAQGQSQISLSQTNLVVSTGQSQTVYITGGDQNGFTVKSNSNPAAVTANIGGTSNVINIYGNNTAGSSIVVVCSRTSANNCATLNVTTLDSSLQNLSFSQNNLSLIPGLSQSVTISGGPDNNYYISSNSNSGVAGANVSGNTITVTGGSNSGSTLIIVCSATVNAKCANLNVVSNAVAANASPNVLAFSQNVVTVPIGGSTNVTITGGTGAGYSISSNSNPNAVTASINGTSNVVTIYGNVAGSSVISICSSAANSICASLYATVGSALTPINFTQNNISIAGNALNINGALMISVSGGTGSNNFISSNSNPNAVSASLSSDNSVLLLKQGTAYGTAAITVCSSVYTSTCGVLNVTNPAPTVTPIIAPVITPVVISDKPNTTTINTNNVSTQTKATYKFKKNLSFGTTDNEVKELQKFLNNNGYAVAKSGVGSPGKETTKFGAATKTAVMKFQADHKIKPVNGSFGPLTRSTVNGL